MNSDTGELARLPAGADVARIRDIPRLCTCEWTLSRRIMRWIRTGPAAGCPWHRGRR